MDMLGISDDDASEDDGDDNGMDDFDDGGGGGGGGMDSAWMSQLDEDDFQETIGRMRVTCFHCLGDGTKGCDVTEMMRDVESYSITCVGKCLNISSGATSVYDCAHDMTSRTNRCLKNGQTEMCFCTGNLCNGPRHPAQYFLQRKTPFFFNTDIVNRDENSEEEISTDLENETKHPGDTTSTTRDEERSKGDNAIIHGGAGDLPGSDLAGGRFENAGKGSADNVSTPHEHGLFLGRPKGDTHGEFPLVQEAEIDVIIPDTNFDHSDNTTSKETSSSDPIDITVLRVGNLKNSDSPEIDNSGNRSYSIVPSYGLLLILFLIKRIL